MTYLRPIFSIMLAIALCVNVSAYASEDTDEYPFPEDFSFDELPDIAPLENETPQALSTTNQMSDTQNNVDNEAELISDNNAALSNAASIFDKTEDTTTGEPTTSSDNLFIPPNNSTTDTAGVDAFDNEKSLTDTLKENTAAENPIEGTWVEKLTSSNPLSLFTSKENEDADSGSDLENLVKGARNKDNNGKSNASVFDIAGVMLRMSLMQTERTLENRGFRKVNAKFQIPNFIKWRNEETCRNEGVVGYERLDACVIQKSKKGGYQYVQMLKYAKFDSKEEIEIYLTSNFTENKVYKIVYRSRIAAITGNSPKAVYIRNIKVYDFWKKINQKYGQPDNKTTVTWGLGGNNPYLKAATGYLVLEDPIFRELDYTRMSREDQRFINSDFYNF